MFVSMYVLVIVVNGNNIVIVLIMVNK